MIITDTKERNRFFNKLLSTIEKTRSNLDL